MISLSDYPKGDMGYLLETIKVKTWFAFLNRLSEVFNLYFIPVVMLSSVVFFFNKQPKFATL